MKAFKTRQQEFEARLKVGSQVGVRFVFEGRLILGPAKVVGLNLDGIETRTTSPVRLYYQDRPILPRDHFIKVPYMGDPRHRVEPMSGY